MRYGRITLQKQRVDIAAAVNSALETAGPLVKAHNHTLRVSMPREPLFVMGDSVRLTQVITNLLQNAARYTLPGGRINLTISAEGDEAVIRVQENGIDIAADILPHIFDYFVQEQPSSESGRRGLGIGLALARQLVELHNGEIEAKSPGRGQGSEFIVRIPLASQGSADPPTAGIEARLAVEPACVRRVLVIDDERDVADSLATLLRKSNHTVWTAYSGMSGIEAALEHNPDVALVDIAMPEMDGYEVARELRERLPEIQLIAVSGLAQEADRRRSLEAGFDSHVAKPARLKQLEELFLKHGDGRVTR